MSPLNKKLKYKTWFTLTELIVVISILAILATIAFLSFQWHSKSARDSARITDMKSIQQWLAISKVKSGTYPLPEWDTLEILVGTEILIQWYIWDNISNIIKINKTPLDPKDAKSYIYTVDKDRVKAQLMWYLENWETINLSSFVDITNQIYADNTNTWAYQDRSPYTIWDKLWILLDENNIPIQETTSSTWINLSSVDTTGYTAYFWWDTYWEWTSTGTWDVLITQMEWAINNTIPCNPISYSWYTITALSHNQTEIFTKPITIVNWTSTWSLSIQCINWNLDTQNATETTTINCNSNYVLDNQICQQDICTWSAPEFSIANWTQKYNILWLHSTTPKDCSYICQAWYYYNTNLCIPASIWNMVPTEWLSTQTPCTANNTYQDSTWQTSCKTVQSWYYSTPIWTWPKTWETQCEANNYCVNWVKTSCPVNYSSPVGSTSLAGCIANTQVATCWWSIPTNASATTTTTYTQTWNSTIWTPTTNWWENQTTCDFNCNTNYSWNWSSCVGNTQTFTCAAKPATWTLWNSVSSYLQTWNWGAWLPANSTTTYNATASTTTCNYKCDTWAWYNWNWTSCISCPSWYSFISARNRCETTPTCTSGTYNPTTDKCDGTSNWVCTALSWSQKNFWAPYAQWYVGGAYTYWPMFYSLDTCNAAFIGTTYNRTCVKITGISSLMAIGSVQTRWTNPNWTYITKTPSFYYPWVWNTGISYTNQAIYVREPGAWFVWSINTIWDWTLLSVDYTCSLWWTYNSLLTCQTWCKQTVQTNATCVSLGILDTVNNVCYVN